VRPTTEMQAALEGSLSPEEMQAASRSALDLSIYRIACRVLKTPGNEPKRQMIESHPLSLQPLIKTECRRIFDLRRGKK